MPHDTGGDPWTGGKLKEGFQGNRKLTRPIKALRGPLKEIERFLFET